MKYATAMLVALFAACVPPHDTSMKGPDGHNYILIRCLHTEECLRRAARYCPNGYSDLHQAHPKDMMIRCTNSTEP